LDLREVSQLLERIWSPWERITRAILDLGRITEGIGFRERPGELLGVFNGHLTKISY